MTYYRIKQYCIKNGLPAGKAEYVRKMILRLVQQKVAEGAAQPIPGVTVAMIRKAESALRNVEPAVCDRESCKLRGVHEDRDHGLGIISNHRTRELGCCAHLNRLNESCVECGRL